jgi:hypothetical protein
MNLFSLLLIVAASFTLSARAFAQGRWAVEKTFHVGGKGGFDYITIDAKSHRLYAAPSKQSRSNFVTPCGQILKLDVAHAFSESMSGPVIRLVRKDIAPRFKTPALALLRNQNRSPF